jgi:alpha-tubulin suppressor-like RCC1 family protein
VTAIPVNLMNIKTRGRAVGAVVSWAVLLFSLVSVVGCVSSGTPWAWGFNGDGELGNGTRSDSSSPVEVTGLPNNVMATAIAGGEFHSLALMSDGTVWAWGDNFTGELGNGTTNASSRPVEVRGLPNKAIAIAAGDYHSLALTSDGTVWAWGLNATRQLGNGTINYSSSPVEVTGLPNNVMATAIAGGAGHSLALMSDGTVWAWGWNFKGQLGNGTTNDSSSPVEVRGLPNKAIAIAGGAYHSLALMSDGTVWAWGLNTFGILGNGTANDSTSPVQVEGLPNKATAIAGGLDHSLALMSDGTVWAWGWNGVGEWGSFTTYSSSSPVEATGLPHMAVAIAGRGLHSLVLMSDGTVWTWGHNGSGQLGDGTTTDHSLPVQVSLSNKATAIAGGEQHSLAIVAGQPLISQPPAHSGNTCGGSNPLPIPGSGFGRGDFCTCNNPAQESGILVCSADRNRLLCCPCSSAPGCGPGSP